MPSDSALKVDIHTIESVVLLSTRLQLCTVMLCWQVKMTVTGTCIAVAQSHEWMVTLFPIVVVVGLSCPVAEIQVIAFYGSQNFTTRQLTPMQALHSRVDASEFNSNITVPI